MGARDRLVRRVRLAADSEEAVRHMLPRLEDALRCATLPDDSNRVRVVRKLALGPIRHDCSAQQLSMLIEHRVAELHAVWQDGDSAQASASDFVEFRSALEARIVLMRRLVRGETCSAWYWPLAVREFRSGDTVRESTRKIALEIAGWPEAPAALPAWVAGLAPAGAIDVLQASFSPDEGAVLLREAGIAVRPRSDRPVLETNAVQSAAQAQREESMKPAGQGLEETTTPLWLTTLLRAAGLPTQGRLSDTRGAEQGVAQAGPVAPAALHRPGHDDPRASHPHQGADSTHTPSPVKDRMRPVGDDQVPDRRRALQQPASAAVEGLGPGTEANAGDVADRLAAPAWLAPTHCGGLLFLLPVLQSLGLPQWCDDDQACAAMTRCILAHALTRLAVPAEDVAWALTTGPVNLQPVAGPAPAIWSDAALRTPAAQPPIELPQALQSASTADQQAQIWLTAVRRWLRRRVGIGLASLVLRPARLECTATHLDMHFYVSDVDMRVRRVGLDIDPGWVPWFGQVVAFHYQERRV